jgi:hypothetical protein
MVKIGPKNFWSSGRWIYRAFLRQFECSNTKSRCMGRDIYDGLSTIPQCPVRNILPDSDRCCQSRDSFSACSMCLKAQGRVAEQRPAWPITGQVIFFNQGRRASGLGRVNENGNNRASFYGERYGTLLSGLFSSFNYWTLTFW